jgi:hypothetical protein
LVDLILTTRHTNKNTQQNIRSVIMKNIIKTTLAIIALSASALSYAASPQMVSRSEAASLQKIGVVSSGGFTTLDDLVASLDMKAADAGPHTTASPVPPV